MAVSSVSTSVPLLSRTEWAAQCPVSPHYVTQGDHLYSTIWPYRTPRHHHNSPQQMLQLVISMLIKVILGNPSFASYNENYWNLKPPTNKAVNYQIKIAGVFICWVHPSLLPLSEYLQVWPWPYLQWPPDQTRPWSTVLKIPKIAILNSDYLVINVVLPSTTNKPSMATGSGADTRNGRNQNNGSLTIQVDWWSSSASSCSKFCPLQHNATLSASPTQVFIFSSLPTHYNYKTSFSCCSHKVFPWNMQQKTKQT